jgi:hypothetical protein
MNLFSLKDITKDSGEIMHNRPSKIISFSEYVAAMESYQTPDRKEFGLEINAFMFRGQNGTQNHNIRTFSTIR